MDDCSPDRLRARADVLLLDNPSYRFAWWLPELRTRIDAVIELYFDFIGQHSAFDCDGLLKTLLANEAQSVQYLIERGVLVPPTASPNGMGSLLMPTIQVFGALETATSCLD